MIDVFIPFWGEPTLLFEAVESVRAQEDPSWRLTVVDDCYPDDSVAEWFEALSDARVTYVRNETNLGITDNYRRCLELATAEWMVFLGCDDVLLPSYVATVGSAIASAEPGVDIVQPGVEVVDERSVRVDPLVDRVKRILFAPRLEGPCVLAGEELAVSVLRGNWTYWPSLCFRTQALRRHDFLNDLPLVQDLALLVDMALGGSKMVVLPEVVFAYRRHSASASSATVHDGSRFEGERAYFDITADRCGRHGWTRARRAARVHAGSRLYAASRMPQAVTNRAWGAAATMGRHAFGR